MGEDELETEDGFEGVGKEKVKGKEKVEEYEKVIMALAIFLVPDFFALYKKQDVIRKL